MTDNAEASDCQEVLEWVKKGEKQGAACVAGYHPERPQGHIWSASEWARRQNKGST